MIQYYSRKRNHALITYGLDHVNLELLASLIIPSLDQLELLYLFQCLPHMDLLVYQLCLHLLVYPTMADLRHGHYRDQRTCRVLERKVLRPTCQSSFLPLKALYLLMVGIHTRSVHYGIEMNSFLN